MGVDARAAGVVSQEVLVVCYSLLFAWAVYALCSHTTYVKTPTLRMFGVLLMLNCALRVAYFAPPPTAWGVNSDQPANDLERFCSGWWLQLVYMVIYLVGNWCVESEYATVLKLWHQAFCVVRNVTHTAPEKVINFGIIAFGVWQLALVVALFFTSQHEVLVCAAFGTVVVRAISTVGYLYYWYHIWSTMMVAAHRPSMWRLLTGGDSHDAPLLIPSHSSHDVMIKAREKLAKISRVCLGYTLCTLFKMGVLMYLLFLLNTFPVTVSIDMQSWWALVFADYFIVEIAAAALVLYVIRKPRRRVASAAGSGSVQVDDDGGVEGDGDNMGRDLTGTMEDGHPRHYHAPSPTASPALSHGPGGRPPPSRSGAKSSGQKRLRGGGTAGSSGDFSAPVHGQGSGANPLSGGVDMLA